MTIAIAFMFKPGHQIEREAFVLAASIREFAVGEVNIHAFIEAADTPYVTDQHQAWFQRMGVRLRELNAKGAFRDRYPHGNKILLCMSEFSEDRVIFLDSDMMVLQPTDFAGITQAPVVATGPLAGNWGDAEKWAPAYQTMGVDPGSVQQWDTPKGGTQMPYFNAGMVSFDPKTNFARTWYDVARRIDDAPEVSDKRPWLDQIALPLTQHTGGPEITRPQNPFFNKRPSRDNLDRLILAHYTMYCFYGAGLDQKADTLLQKHLGISLSDLEQHNIANQARVQRKISGRKRPFAKVYGERHTGVATVEALISRKFRVAQPRTQADGPAARGFMRAALGSEAAQHGNIFDMSDRIFRRTGMGWRHGAPPLDIIERSVYRDEATFVLLYRDPWTWLRAMYRKPFNPLLKGDKGTDFADFLRRPFPTSERDRVDLPDGATALEVYQAKLHSYLRLNAMLPGQCVFLPWSALDRRQYRVLAALAPHMKINALKALATKAEPLTGPKGGAAYSTAERSYVEDRLDTALWSQLSTLASV